MNASGQNSKIIKAANANQNIQVYVRLRPTNNRERSIRSQEVVEVPNSREVIARVLLDAKTQKKFSFDRAFGPDSKQVSFWRRCFGNFTWILYEILVFINRMRFMRL